MEFLPERTPVIYHTNYTGYVDERRKNHELAEKAYDLQQTHIASEKTLINRFRAGSRAGMAQSRSKALDKLDVIEKPLSRAEPKFRFESVKESPQWILLFEDAFIGRTEPLFFIPELSMQRGDRIGIVGEN
jgi:ATP-binding cassette, subfamily F, member 3